MKTHDGIWLGGESWGGDEMEARSPIDGAVIGRVRGGRAPDVGRIAAAQVEAFRAWRVVPGPVRGELVRRIGERVRAEKASLAGLITREVGKIGSEAEGEVQEWIDMCEFAVGLSRQLHGLTIASERVRHRMMEQWHPLGPVAVISAFNFPVAVWAWNAMLALVCGDPVVWKPSEKANLCAIAAHRIAVEAAATMDEAPAGLLALVCGGKEVGEALAAEERYPLVSATGSVPMGRSVGRVVAGRLGRSLLELGGNNALIVTPTADPEMAVRAIVFAAAGTAGQRCTTLRRLIVHESIADGLVERLATIYRKLTVGDPRNERVLVGPLIDEGAAGAMEAALHAAVAQGGRVVAGGERVVEGVPEGGAYMRPAIVEIGADSVIVQSETFAPLLYVHRYRSFEEAVAIQNGVPQGLSSAVFTSDVREAEWFLGPEGSDCGIANVNLGTSGAEIGGAFGGEKWTGGGRESGSDSWKAYMRRATNTVNYGRDLPLAQGVSFDVAE